MELTPIIIVPAIFYFVYKVLESLIRRKERLMLVEKFDLSNLQALPSSQEALHVLDYMPNKRFSSLRAGLLIVGLGLGLCVAWALTIGTGLYLADDGSVSARYWEYRRMFDTIFLAAPALFGGIGLLISFLMEQKMRKQE